MLSVQEGRWCFSLYSWIETLRRLLILTHPLPFGRHSGQCRAHTQEIWSMRNWLFSSSDSSGINLCFPKVLRQKLSECFPRTRCGQAKEKYLAWNTCLWRCPGGLPIGARCPQGGTGGTSVRSKILYFLRSKKEVINHKPEYLAS